MPESAEGPASRAALAAQLNELAATEAALMTFLPKLVLAGSCVQFRTLVSTHLLETEGQAARLKRAAKEINLELEPAQAAKIHQLIAATQRLMAQDAPPLGKDLDLAEAARGIEREEIAAYRRACALAATAGEAGLRVALEKTLKEEEAAERLLASLAGEIAAGSIRPTPPA